MENPLLSSPPLLAWHCYSFEPLLYACFTLNTSPVHLQQDLPRTTAINAPIKYTFNQNCNSHSVLLFQLLLSSPAHYHIWSAWCVEDKCSLTEVRTFGIGTASNFFASHLDPIGMNNYVCKICANSNIFSPLWSAAHSITSHYLRKCLDKLTTGCTVEWCICVKSFVGTIAHKQWGKTKVLANRLWCCL